MAPTPSEAVPGDEFAGLVATLSAEVLRLRGVAADLWDELHPGPAWLGVPNPHRPPAPPLDPAEASLRAAMRRAIRTSASEADRTHAYLQGKPDPRDH